MPTKPYALHTLAQLIGGKVEGDDQLQVSSFAPIEKAHAGDLTFLSNPKYEPYLYTTEATATLVADSFVPQGSFTTTLIRVADPYKALAALMQLAESKFTPTGQEVSSLAWIHASVVLPKNCFVGAFTYIDEGVTLEEGVVIYPHCYIGAHSHIGTSSTLYPHVTLYPKSQVGERCILHAGSVIGADGFGFAPTEKGYEKIPQLGNVVLSDDVEIGANACIDRAVMGHTQIGEGTKIDNLVQIGHNSVVGKHNVLAAQVGMAGSTSLGSWCRLGGQVGLVGHISVGDHVEMGGQTGVLGNIKSGRKLLGSPAMEASKALRSYALLPKLPSLLDRIEELEKSFKELTERLS